MDTDTAVEAQLATVWTTPQGAPARLVWNQRRFIVYTRPIPVERPHPLVGDRARKP